MARLSVVLPVFNAERFLGESIDGLLRQSYSDFELIVVDDGSTDGSRERVAGFADPRIRLLVNPANLGQTASLNRGLRAALGELVARQDADDVAAPQRFARQVEHLDRHDGVSVLGTQGTSIDQRGRRRGPLARPCADAVMRWELLIDNPLLHTSVMFRRSVVVDALGGYDESFAYCQDRELWSRVARVGRLANLPSRLVACRHHPGTMTVTLRQQNFSENRRVNAAASEALVGARLPDHELELLARFREGPDETSFSALCGLYQRLLASWLERHPELAASADMRACVARQIGSLARAPRVPRRARLAMLAWGASRGYPVGRWLTSAAVARIRRLARRDPA